MCCEQLVISGATTWYPFAFTDENSNAKRGLAYELITEIGQKLDIPIMIQVDSYPWKRVLAQLKKGDIDAVTGIFWTEKRAEEYVFSEPIVGVENVIFVKKGQEFEFNTFDDLIGKTAGNVLGGAFGGGFDEFLEDKLSITRVGSHHQYFNMLMLGRIDYIPLTYKSGIRIAKKLGIENDIAVLPKPLSKTAIRIAFSKASTCKNLLPKVNVAIQQLKADGTVNKLGKKFGVL